MNKKPFSVSKPSALSSKRLMELKDRFSGTNKLNSILGTIHLHEFERERLRVLHGAASKHLGPNNIETLALLAQMKRIDKKVERARTAHLEAAISLKKKQIVEEYSLHGRSQRFHMLENVLANYETMLEKRPTAPKPVQALVPVEEKAASAFASKTESKLSGPRRKRSLSSVGASP